MLYGRLYGASKSDYALICAPIRTGCTPRPQQWLAHNGHRVHCRLSPYYQLVSQTRSRASTGGPIHVKPTF
ncbi:hypothetical protein BAUCODRAFT_391748 [Baudoinia panamericana UAMH 10762]|uniref:Uncharacterized protein n=1 Tax=Baudoinia panamericana (strain UAMH 10762) TaxID=717646 RepID=M2N535_BAUPA|nr:uncharacterized protein BAUCODRAFT_391748 [Baudoinia panamericana UAMH 10762]EMC99113.1 hypothetical protein BAUCODRAFT_391748 [Baudoinia panamericana UAMH 10762]